jgi:hypothetical protein
LALSWLKWTSRLSQNLITAFAVAAGLIFAATKFRYYPQLKQREAGKTFAAGAGLHCTSRMA